MNDKTTDSLRTVQQFAQQLGICVRQVFKLQAAGLLPKGLKLGRSLRWKASVISDFIQADCDMLRFEHERDSRLTP